MIWPVTMDWRPRGTKTLDSGKWIQFPGRKDIANSWCDWSLPVYSLSAALTANSGLSAFGIGTHISTAVTAGLNHEMSRALSGFRSRGSSRTISSSNSHGKRKGLSRTNGSFFNNGFHKTVRTDKTLSYEYTLTVPALHRGHIAFFVAETPNILKWKATFRLNGHVRVSTIVSPCSIHAYFL